MGQFLAITAADKVAAKAAVLAALDQRVSEGNMPSTVRTIIKNFINNFIDAEDDPAAGELISVKVYGHLTRRGLAGTPIRSLGLGAVVELV